jgi:outer membrane immunogenic protein
VKSLFIIGISATALLVAPAMAADMPLKMPVKVPPPALVSSWSGFYGGINGGYGWGSASGDIVSSDPLTNVALVGALSFTPPFSSSFRQSGGIAGLQAGYNWQLPSNIIAGLETDFQYANVGGSQSHVTYVNQSIFGNAFPFNVDAQRTLNWFGTFRGRLGFLATPNLLIYGTGGLAYGRTTASGSMTLAPPAGIGDQFIGNCLVTGPAALTCYTGSSARTSAGWTAGAGFEYLIFHNVTAKFEYLHIDLGGQVATLASPVIPGGFIGYGYNHEIVDAVRVGLNYRFGN